MIILLSANNAKQSRTKSNFSIFLPKNGIIHIKLVEHGPMKTVTHISGLKELFPDIDIYNLHSFYFVGYMKLLNLNFGLCFYNYSIYYDFARFFFRSSTTILNYCNAL